MSRLASVGAGVLVFMLFASFAFAAPGAEVKAGKGVEANKPTETGDTFAVGDTVWVWSNITDAEGTSVKHVWKKDDKEVWTASLEIKSKNWSTWTRRAMSSAGSWTVEVQAADGSKIGSVSFTVK